MNQLQKLNEEDFYKLSNTLDSQQLSSIEVIKQDLISMLSQNIDVRTNSQIKFSILNDLDHPTVDSKYWQLFREIKASFGSLLSGSIQFELEEIDLEEIDFMILKNEESPIDPILKNISKRRLEIQKKQKIYHLESMKQSSKYQLEEVLRMYSIFQELRSNLEYSEDNRDAYQVEAILKKVLANLEVEFSKGSANLNDVYTLLGHLKSFKKAAVEYGIMDKISKELNTRQIAILDEQFDLYKK